MFKAAKIARFKVETVWPLSETVIKLDSYFSVFRTSQHQLLNILSQIILPYPLIHDILYMEKVL